jgi:hypothetical protein
MTGQATRPVARRLRLLAVLAVTLLTAAVAASPLATSSAFFTDTSTASGSSTTATLDPPTGLSASAVGLVVTLTWTASPDAAVSAGYQVLRATVSGGPFSQVGTVTPASATTTNDTVPASGTYYYVLKTYAGGAPWTSVAAGQASAVVSVTTDTGWKACASQGAVTVSSGDNNGYQTNPAEACDDDSVFAVDTNSGTNSSPLCDHSGKDRHRFWGFALGLPGAVTAIKGIEVRGDLKADSTTSSPTVCMRLSWNGGTSWTAFVALGSTLTTSEATYTMGGTADLWGRASWSLAELGASTFRVEITDVAQGTARDFSLDGLKVRVTYTP